MLVRDLLTPLSAPTACSSTYIVSVAWHLVQYLDRKGSSPPPSPRAAAGDETAVSVGQAKGYLGRVEAACLLEAAMSCSPYNHNLKVGGWFSSSLHRARRAPTPLAVLIILACRKPPLFVSFLLLIEGEGAPRLARLPPPHPRLAFRTSGGSCRISREACLPVAACTECT